MAARLPFGVALVSAAALVAQVPYDDFGGTAVDPVLWYDDASAGLAVGGGLLRTSFPYGYAEANLWSTHGFTGDYEFVLDFRNRTGFGLLDLEMVDCDPLGARGSIRLQLDTDIQAMPVQTLRGYVTYRPVEATVTLAQGDITPAAVMTAGELRLRRVTAAGPPVTYTLSAEFRASPTSAWVPVVCHTHDASSPMFAEVSMLHVRSWATRRPFAIDSDGVRYSGTPWPNPPDGYGDRCERISVRAGLPRLAKSFPVQVVGASDLPFVGLGISRTTSPLGPLPLSMAPFGAAGCFLNTSTDQWCVGGFTRFGSHTCLFLVPNDATLLGVRLFAQAAGRGTSTPPSNTLLSFSGGIEFVIVP